MNNHDNASYAYTICEYGPFSLMNMLPSSMLSKIRRLFPTSWIRFDILYQHHTTFFPWHGLNSYEDTMDQEHFALRYE